MKDLKAIKGRFYISRLIEEGEHEHQDFKFAISDARKIARSISAFANNDGGRLLVGVKDNGAIAGVRNEEDIFVVEQAAAMYCEPEVPIEVTAFAVGDGHIVLRVEIARAERRPVMVRESDGRRRAYYRVKDENIVAHPLMTAVWQRREQDAGMPPLSINADSPERRLLDILQRGPAGVENLAVQTHLSAETIRRAVVSLAAIDLVTFRYIDGQFKIALS